MTIQSFSDFVFSINVQRQQRNNFFLDEITLTSKLMLLDTTGHETDVSITSVASSIERSSFYSVAVSIMWVNHVTMINTWHEKRYLNCFLTNDIMI